jgi:hypothetical protein
VVARFPGEASVSTESRSRGRRDGSIFYTVFQKYFWKLVFFERLGEGEDNQSWGCTIFTHPTKDIIVDA